jgi:hypothetical protein
MAGCDAVDGRSGVAGLVQRSAVGADDSVCVIDQLKRSERQESCAGARRRRVSGKAREVWGVGYNDRGDFGTALNLAQLPLRNSSAVDGHCASERAAHRANQPGRSDEPDGLAWCVLVGALRSEISWHERMVRIGKTPGAEPNESSGAQRCYRAAAGASSRISNREPFPSSIERGMLCGEQDAGGVTG